METENFASGKKIEFSNRVFWILALLIGALVISYIGHLFYEFKNLPQNQPQQISVSAQGKAYVKPDIATVSFGVNTQAQKSQDAVNKNNEAMNKIIQSVKESGVEEKDIKTTSYNLYPSYDYTQFGRVFNGYSLDQQIQVKIRDFSKISNILDRATASGATTVGDLQFTVDDMDLVKAQARKEAIEKAKQKAMALVGQAGLKLGKLVNVYENDASPDYPVAYGFGGADMERTTTIAPEVQTGQQEISVGVTLIYQVK